MFIGLKVAVGRIRKKLKFGDPVVGCSSAHSPSSSFSLIPSLPMITTVDDFCIFLMRSAKLFNDSFPKREECLLTFPKHYLTAIPEYADLAKFPPGVNAGVIAHWALCPRMTGIQFGFAADDGITAAVRFASGPTTTWKFAVSEITELYLTKLAALHAATVGPGGRVEIVLPYDFVYPPQPKTSHFYYSPPSATAVFDPSKMCKALSSSLAPHTVEVAFRAMDVVVRGTA